MAIYEYPLNSLDSSFKLRTKFPGYDVVPDIEVVFFINWNARMGRWCLSILDASENPLLQGVPMLVNTEIITRFEIDGIPGGALILLDESSSVECGRDDLGNRCRLYYVTPEAVA